MKRTKKTAFGLSIFSAICSVMGWSISSTPAQATVLVNGDFETGDLSGWTVFNTTNGTIGQPFFPTLVPEADIFATGGEQTMAVHVGQASFMPGQPAGGGLFQTVNLAGGNFELVADIAALNDSFNASGGLFSLLFDGQVIAEHNFSSVLANRLSQKTLRGTVFDVLPGEHEVRLQVQRPYQQNAQTPRQYVDNIALRSLPAAPDQGSDAESVPEPGVVLALLGGGVMALGLRRN
ncbi:MAG: PEP-CTERM sorting domain-containing protein [Spirulinaceae cyanobacterium]